MRVTSISGIGSEILAAMNSNGHVRSQRYNLRNAKAYLKYCISTGDQIMIDYANKLLLAEQPIA